MIEKALSPSETLVSKFLEKAKELHTDNIELIRVLKARTYRIAEANVLIRSASEGNKRYFFGLNYLTVEQMANLDNPFIAFICGSVDRTLIIPAQSLFRNLSSISHDRDGEYKINIDKDLNIVLKGRGNILDCGQYINSWQLLLKPFDLPDQKSTVEESLHSILQGRLLEIGNIRGFLTYCPDKSKKFNNRQLSDIATLKRCPELQFSDYDTLRKIDVLWFREKRENIIPEKAFEVELSTGSWSGIGRMATLVDYPNVGLYVISDDRKRYNQVMHSFADYASRFKHIPTDLIGDLYSAELQLNELRDKIGL
ncbi:MAG: hypothetical protein ACREOP_03595 [Thermodesulfobacteriota bacterium]